MCRAQYLVETNHELASALFTKKDKTLLEENASINQDQKRKLSRMEAVRKNEADHTQVVGVSLTLVVTLTYLTLTLVLLQTFRQEKEERSRDLKTIELYREQTKKEGILTMLNQAITTEHSLSPCMGSTEFFEFVLHNPYNVEHTVYLDVDDHELV